MLVLLSSLLHGSFEMLSFNFTAYTDSRTLDLTISVVEERGVPYTDLEDDAEELAWEKARTKLGTDEFELVSQP